MNCWLESVLFRELPYAQPDRLICPGMKAPGGNNEFLLESAFYSFRLIARGIANSSGVFALPAGISQPAAGQPMRRAAGMDPPRVPRHE